MSKNPVHDPGTPPRRPSLTSLAINLLVMAIILGAILFVSAGRLNWIQGWLFLLSFTGFLACYGGWALKNDPGQLKERSRAGANTKKWDKVILRAYTQLLLSMLIVAGLDAGRFRWAPAPLALQVLGWIGAVFAGWMVFWTVSVNTFLSRTVRIQDDRGQQVVENGPYSLVRHPMYLGVIVLMLSIPLLLGSLWALIPGGVIGALFILRTALEDKMLIKELPGYSEYASRVRYRLLPGLW
jgi:protein-S-isoprenylcysteine O-methyltransferase Ste14